jgi:hypothetical protein
VIVIGLHCVVLIGTLLFGESIVLIIDSPGNPFGRLVCRRPLLHRSCIVSVVFLLTDFLVD